MKLSTAAITILFASVLQSVSAASSWGFTDATITTHSKGAESGLKEKLAENSPLSKAVKLSSSNSLKIILTTQDGKTAKRPHQAFLSLSDAITGLETSFPFSVKDSGKAKVEISQRDIPTQLLLSEKPLLASLVIASFGSSTPYNSKAFDIAITFDSDSPAPVAGKPLRYGQLPEIHHIFRADAKSPPVVITLVFTAAVLAAPVILVGLWIFLGANLNHVGKALNDAPVTHGLFFGSILAMEGLFFMYYTSWNLFQTLPVAIALGTVMFISGSGALTEVQERRLAGLR